MNNESKTKNNHEVKKNIRFDTYKLGSLAIISSTIPEKSPKSKINGELIKTKSVEYKLPSWIDGISIPVINGNHSIKYKPPTKIGSLYFHFFFQNFFSI